MTLSIISLIANIICVLGSVIWLITSITSSRRMDKIELIISGHSTHIFEVRRTIKRLERKISDLEMRLNELDNKTTDDSSCGTCESD